MDLKVGDIVEFLDEDYNHMPAGTKAIWQDMRIPSHTIVMVKDRRVTAIWDRRNHIEESDMLEAMRQSDGLLVNPNEGPEATMGQAWTDQALKDARKFYN